MSVCNFSFKFEGLEVGIDSVCGEARHPRYDYVIVNVIKTFLFQRGFTSNHSKLRLIIII